MDEITDGILIGGITDARGDLPGVDAVLCLVAGCSCETRDDVAAFCVPLKDGPGNEAKRIAMAVAFIEQIVAEGGRILIHCQAGRSRSPAIVARYLMVHRGLEPRDAVAVVASRRDIWLTPGIQDMLTLPVLGRDRGTPSTP